MIRPASLLKALLIPIAIAVVLGTPFFRDSLISGVASACSGYQTRASGSHFESLRKIGFKQVIVSRRGEVALETGPGSCSLEMTGLHLRLTNVEIGEKWAASSGLLSWIKAAPQDPRWNVSEAQVRIMHRKGFRDWHILRFVTQDLSVRGRVRTREGHLAKAFVRAVIRPGSELEASNPWLQKLSAGEGSHRSTFHFMYSGKTISLYGPKGPLFRMQWQSYGVK